MGAYRIQTLYRRGVRVKIGLGFSIDETIGGQLTTARRPFTALQFYLNITLSSVPDKNSMYLWNVVGLVGMFIVQWNLRIKDTLGCSGAWWVCL